MRSGGSYSPSQDPMSESSSLRDIVAVLCAADLGIGQPRRHHPNLVMGNPSLLPLPPDIAALLPECVGNGEQTTAADRSLAGLDAMADLDLNHTMVQSTYS